MYNKPETKVTTIRDYGLDAVHKLANKYGMSNIDIVTFVMLAVLQSSDENQERLIYGGAKINGILLIGGKITIDGKLVWSDPTLPIRPPNIIVDLD